MNWTLILFVTVATIGILGWLKEGAKLALPDKPTPSLVWWVLMPLVTIGAAYMYLHAPDFVSVGTSAIAFVQFGYENVVKLIQAKIEQLKT